MKKQGILPIALFFSIIFTQTSLPSLNSSIEHEFPGAPCPSLCNSFAFRPTSSITESSIVTVPHEIAFQDVSPLDAQNLSALSILESEQNSPVKPTKITPLNSHRWYVSRKPSDISEDWRADSTVEENGNAQKIVLLPSKNERLFRKTYLAAALRGKQASNSPLRSNNTRLTKTNNQKIFYGDDLLEEQDQHDIAKDCRRSLHQNVSKKEERSSTDDAFWKRHQDPAFWE